MDGWTVDYRCTHLPTLPYPADGRDREKEEGHQVAVVLKVHVVHQEQARAPHRQRGEEEELGGGPTAGPGPGPAVEEGGRGGVRPDARQEQAVGEHDAEALEPHGGRAGVGLGRDAQGPGVEGQEGAGGEGGEGAFEEGEEGGVVQGPFGGSLKVPGSGMGRGWDLEKGRARGVRANQSQRTTPSRAGRM